jgi:hypothetical protein
MTRISFNSNPTGLQNIESNKIIISYNRDSSSNIESFSVIKIDLNGLSLPTDAQLFLFVISKWAEKRIELGNVSLPELKKNVSFGEVEPIGALFRLIVKKKDEHLLLATCERIKSTIDDFDNEGILLTEPGDIGEKIFELRLSEDKMPTLVVNNSDDLMMIQKVRDRDPIIRAYIIPQIIESILIYSKLKPAIDDDPVRWQNVWGKYISENTSNSSLNFENVDEHLDDLHYWARELSSEISNQIKFATILENSLEVNFDE